MAKGKLGSAMTVMRYTYRSFIFTRVLFIKAKDLYNLSVHKRELLKIMENNKIMKSIGAIPKK